ncbi:MAG: hypothetical protein D3904_06460 [Candidatus Electrothrix sp. EH2]|nr:hypothetical protein [Candidatus Electrothrix sp. EH2]
MWTNRELTGRIEQITDHEVLQELRIGLRFVAPMCRSVRCGVRIRAGVTRLHRSIISWSQEEERFVLCLLIT